MVFSLKSCPFCGSGVYVEKKPLWTTHGNITHGYVGNYEYVIKCPNDKCGCSVNLGNNYDIYIAEEEAIKNAVDAWNRRI